jgi:hypothetical protein
MSSVAASPPKSLAAITAPMTLYPQLKFLAWSPDSKWLVVSDGPSYGGVMGLFLLSVETGEKRTLTLPPKTTTMSIRPSLLMGDIWLSFVIGVEEHSRVISTFSIFL